VAEHVQGSEFVRHDRSYEIGSVDKAFPVRQKEPGVTIGLSLEHTGCLASLWLGRRFEETTMKLKTIALAGALALSSTLAFAQGGGAASPGAATPENSGPATNAQGGAAGNGKTHMNNGATTGMSSGAAAKPGGIDESKPGGQSTARKPPG
jgi:hypothetical protein